MDFSSNGINGNAAVEYVKGKQSGLIKTTIQPPHPVNHVISKPEITNSYKAA